MDYLKNQALPMAVQPNSGQVFFIALSIMMHNYGINPRPEAHKDRET